MKKFIKRTFITALPLLLIFVITIVTLVEYQTTYSAKHDALRNASNKNVTLVFGNSHASYAVNTDSIRSINTIVFNLATPNQKLNEDLYILEKLISEKQVEIQSILLSLDYHSFYDNKTKGIELNWILNEYGGHKNAYLRACKYITTMPPAIILSGVKKRFSGLKYWNAEKGTNNGSVSPCGFLPLIGNQEGWRSTERYSKRINVFFGQEPARETIASSLDIIDSIFKICEQNNIQLYLFTAPTFSEYNELLNKTKLFINDSLIELISEKYNATYFNYMNDTAFKAAHFYNADHLNKEGSFLLSTKINKDIFECSDLFP